jgi:protein TonB
MLDRIPRTVAQPAPDYPLALRQAGVEGEVVIEFDVDTTGRVITARVAQGGLPEFEQAALRAVLRWRFEPGRRDGRIVPFRMAVPIGFRVSEE